MSKVVWIECIKIKTSTSISGYKKMKEEIYFPLSRVNLKVEWIDFEFSQDNWRSQFSLSTTKTSHQYSNTIRSYLNC